MIRTSRAAATVASLALLLGWTVACGTSDPSPSEPVVPALDAQPTSDAATEDVVDASEAGPRCTPPGKFGSPDCTACVGMTCCDQFAACEADENCAALRACALACIQGTDAGGCLADCKEEHSDTKSLWQNVNDCWFGPPPRGCLTVCSTRVNG